MSKQVQSYPGYTLVRREESSLFHGVATTLTHDVSGATVLLVENEDENKAFGIGFGTFPCDDTGCSTFWSTRCWQGRKNTR